MEADTKVDVFPDLCCKGALGRNADDSSQEERWMDCQLRRAGNFSFIFYFV